MNTVQNLFQQAQLAEAAYANLAGITTSTTPGDLALVLANTALDGKFSAAQATAFTNDWSVRPPGSGLAKSHFIAPLPIL
jgi:hypothetical protein